ncbi:MAG: hypothetical protein AAGH41_10490 [Pseudomonadota bacterium]
MLWALFGLVVAQSLGFVLIMVIWDFQIIDEMRDPEVIRTHINAITDVQRSVHVWTTSTLDVTYPLTYGALLAGVTRRSLPSVFCLPALAAVPTDLAEGVVQVLALSSVADVLEWKAVLTPLKFALLGVAIVLAFIAIGLGRRKQLR